MNNQEKKELCFALMTADSEEEVIRILKEAGFWDDSDLWRYYGDYENNFNQIGNQMARPDAAVVEKIINSIDARLMNKCLEHGINPESSSTPSTITEAVNMFFGGNIKHWGKEDRSKIAKDITLAATGFKPTEGQPCISIADCGEGQTPNKMPQTFLSLTESNKMRIPFVQGKFNMGGTGALKFCGRRNLQLIVTRRNPDLLSKTKINDNDAEWGFTIIRREDPEGERRNSVYTYLAPFNRVLSFYSDSMPIFPEGEKAYARKAEWGTLIKLYEYSNTGFSKSDILRRNGLLSRIDLLIPEAALPIRLHECRGYGGGKSSHDTTVTGLCIRLENNRLEEKENILEDGFPNTCPITVDGEPLTLNIYAFKDKKNADIYRNNEGIIFTINGQTHGYFTIDFFRRKNIGFPSYLANCILVMVDCSKFSGRAREDLFMNSRDRLSNCELRKNIEKALEEEFKGHDGLRALMEKKRRERVESTAEDSKPFENVLQSMLKQSPTLSELFIKGNRLSTPFKSKKAQEKEKPFVGKKHPTYFKFKNKKPGQFLSRNCNINKRCRVSFETDVANDYFKRDENQGEFILYLNKNESLIPYDNYSVNLYNGIATLNIQLPECEIGDKLLFKSYVNDPTLIFPFENDFELIVDKAIEDNGGGNGKRKSPPSDKEGNEREISSGISLPKIKQIYESSWNEQTPSFDQYTALRVEPSGEEGIYDFFVNMDNIYLKTELKNKKTETTELVKARFAYGLVLVGLSLLHGSEDKEHEEDTENNKEEQTGKENGKSIEDKVAEVTRSIAPIILPMIENLSNFDIDLEESQIINNLGEVI